MNSETARLIGLTVRADDFNKNPPLKRGGFVFSGFAFYLFCFAL